MKLTALLFTLLSLALVTSCGGNKGSDGTTPGTTHSSGDGDGDISDDIDAPISSQLPDAGSSQTTEPAAPVTFVLKNSSDEELFLNMDKGWQAVIFAYSGKPPNAKSMLMFPTHCTASCDAAEDAICPYCPEPERVKDIKAAENHDAVAPGDARTVPWDGMAFKYKKTKGIREGKRAKCKCSELEDPVPETYTIKACGLRKTQSAKQRSKYECVEGTLTLPIEEPVVVELDFKG